MKRKKKRISYSEWILNRLRRIKRPGIASRYVVGITNGIRRKILGSKLYKQRRDKIIKKNKRGRLT